MRITKATYEQIRAHGERTYPHECCGALLANEEGLIVKAEPCGNTRADSPHNRYNIDPKDLIRIQLDSREEGLDIAGFYHSHPDHPAQWSKTDLAEAHWFGCSYVITRVAQGKAENTNSFLLQGGDEDNKRFEDEPVEVVESVVSAR